MRVFDEYPQSAHKCPVCGTRDKKPSVLIAIKGREHGNNVEAHPFHIGCIELEYDPDSLAPAGVIYAAFVKKADVISQWGARNVQP